MPHQPPLDPSWVDAGCPLRPRQLQVLALVAAGRSQEQIARELCLSVRTVEWHVRRSRLLLGATSEAHAVTLAISLGWLAVDRAAAWRHVSRAGRAA